MDQSSIVSLEEGGLGETRILCGACGLERAWTVKECRVCEVMARNVALEEEVRETKRELSTAKSQLEEISRHVKELRGAASVRSRLDGPGTGDGSDEVEREGGSQRGEGGWQIVRTGRREGKRQLPDRRGDGRSGIESENKYSVLANLKEGNDQVSVVTELEDSVVIEIEEDDEDRTPPAKITKNREGKRERMEKNRRAKTREVLVVGDSRVKFLDRTFGEDNRRSRTTCCLPGAGVKDVVSRFKQMVKGTSEEAVVVVHVGVNDVGKMGSEELYTWYRELMREMQESRRICLVQGVLPKLNAGQDWQSRAIGMNERVKELCREYGIGFADYWNRFYGKQEMYARDGTHFSMKGVEELGRCTDRAVRQYSQGN